MKSRLFWRLFFTLVGTLIATVLVLTLTMTTLIRAERQNSLEAEVRLQARDVALLLNQRDSFQLWRSDVGLSEALQQKLSEIRARYGADVWLVLSSGIALTLGEDASSPSKLEDEQALEQIRLVLSGDEIRVQGLFSELGDAIVTIGVPWGAENRVLGAVLLHISVDKLSVDYSDIIQYATIAAVLALILGTALSYVIARTQTRPLHEIQAAVSEFTAGRLDRRVPVRGSDEMARLAEAINRMAGELSTLEASRQSFVASVSHELRSPMTCMKGYVQGMLDGTIPPEEQGKYLQTVLDETERLTKLVNELLDLSRIESGGFPLNQTRFDVDELILSTMFQYERRIEEKHIGVEISFREQPCYVVADADRIRQVVGNLVDNAVKFLGDGGQLTVWTHGADALCYVTVKNDGPPIAPDDLPFIFDRFYKADKAHTSGMGTGLGLSIVKKILEQHGQSINVTSGAGGTSFVFTLRKSEE